MKKYICLILLFLGFSLHRAEAQTTPYLIVGDSIRGDISGALNDSLIVFPDSLKAKLKKPISERDSIAMSYKMYGWYLNPYSGDRTIVNVDSTLVDFHQTSLIDGQGIAVGYLGNMGSPMQSKLFFERKDQSIFPFLDAFDYYYKTPEEHMFLNTKVPYSNIYYQKAGSKQNSEERFKASLSSNFGKKLNLGFDIDYIYSRGFYSNLSNKQMTYNLYGSYVSDRYQMHAYVANNYYNNSENEGITDMRYITDPTNPDVQALKNNTNSKSIPVRVNSMWNRLKGRQLFMNHRYNVGYEMGDSNEFIPVASFILTTNYTDQQRRFASKDQSVVKPSTGQTATDTLYNHNYYQSGNKFGIMSNTPAADQMAYWSLKNSFAISLNEGFKDWVKFGLTAYVEHDIRKFSLPSVENPTPLVTTVHSQNSTFIGGQLTKERGRLLRYNLDARLGVIGANLGELKLEGNASTSIRIAGKDAVVRVNAHLKNLTPTFYQERFQTKYIRWIEELKNTQKVYIGGEIIIPQTNTRLSGGVENIQNHIYYGSDSLLQSSKNIQVVALRLDQKLNAGILHWDNQIAYQTSTEEGIIPLPKLSAYTNLYLLTKVGPVLTIQLGVDAHIHTKYYVPRYEPVTLQFHNQKDVKIGGFPIATAYLNVHLKKTRFFAMMYNIAESLGDSEYFTLPYYPVNPMVFKMGISWDFSN
ncbi:hypothetical protein D0T53_00075 [Dysgonomonas sp. 216]|uniref:putative porin n=1 Tax=Dysgonomonas sp. 216 TaxID=2302934 RepID=UPI0013D302A2|nr:putative porin [Dysgonomonas sp. 216]NDW17309.1 hypothetical protein [Dysgonomonas sp. 216]